MQQSKFFGSNEQEMTDPVNDWQEIDPASDLVPPPSPHFPFSELPQSNVTCVSPLVPVEDEEGFFVSDDNVGTTTTAPASRVRSPSFDLSLIDPQLLAKSAAVPDPASSMGQKRSRSSPDTTMEPTKKAQTSGDDKKPSNKSVLSWYVEDHPDADLGNFQTFCINVKEFISKYNLVDTASVQRMVVIRQQLHKLPFHQGITDAFLIQSDIIEQGLKLIWLNPDKFPYDMCDFASELSWKWTHGRQSPNIHHGLLVSLTRSEKKLLRTWKFDIDTVRPKVDSLYGGQGHLFCGQWWPKNYLAQRDGAHGNSMTGIHGTAANGALSIVLSSFKENSEDSDNGDDIVYCGQAGHSDKIPAGTKYLMTAERLGNHIRVFRTANLPTSNQYRPEKGIRFDGLYEIIKVEKVDQSLEQDEKPKAKVKKDKKDKKDDDDKPIKKVSHKFVLQRLPGQSPIYCKQVPGSRPTAEEIAEYEKADDMNNLAFEQAKRQETAAIAPEAETPFAEDSDPEVEEMEDIEDEMFRQTLEQSLNES